MKIQVVLNNGSIETLDIPNDLPDMESVYWKSACHFTHYDTVNVFCGWKRECRESADAIRYHQSFGNVPVCIDHLTN